MLKSSIAFTLALAATLPLSSVASPVDSLDVRAAGWFENAASGTLSARVNPAVYWRAYPASGCSGDYSTLQSASGTCYVLPATGSLKITGWASGCTGTSHKIRAYASAGCPTSGAYVDFTNPLSCYSMSGKRSMKVFC